jgi:hypothetical protein
VLGQETFGLANFGQLSTFSFSWKSDIGAARIVQSRHLFYNRGPAKGEFQSLFDVDVAWTLNPNKPSRAARRAEALKLAWLSWSLELGVWRLEVGDQNALEYVLVGTFLVFALFSSDSLLLIAVNHAFSKHRFPCTLGHRFFSCVLAFGYSDWAIQFLSDVWRPGRAPWAQRDCSSVDQGTIWFRFRFRLSYSPLLRAMRMTLEGGVKECLSVCPVTRHGGKVRTHVSCVSCSLKNLNYLSSRLEVRRVFAG